MTDATTQERFTALLAEHRGRLRKVVLAYGNTREDREDLFERE